MDTPGTAGLFLSRLPVQNGIGTFLPRGLSSEFNSQTQLMRRRASLQLAGGDQIGRGEQTYKQAQEPYRIQGQRTVLFAASPTWSAELIGWSSS